ncbi:MAG: lipopolysaccharide biosynthesis protein, partial [Balneolaceae bacterium]
MKLLRELLSDSLIYGISSVLARFINYLLVPFHTDVFNPARYSIVGLVYAAIAFLNVMFTMGMESAYLRYAKNRDEAPHIFKTLQLGLLGAATLFTLILYFLMHYLLPIFNLGSETEGIYLMMLGILWFDTLSIVPFAELRLVRRSYLFAVLRTIHVFINLFLNFYLILSLGFGIEAVFIANLAASVIVTLAVWAATGNLLRGKWSYQWLSTSFRFGWPFIPAGIGFVINEMLDRFFLNEMNPAIAEQIYGIGITPADIVGIYNACYKLSVFMLLLVQMYRMAWQPFFMRHSDEKQAPEIFAKAFGYFNIAAAFAFLSVSLFREQIVAINIPVLNASIIGEAYWSGLDIVPYLLLAYWFHGWYVNFSAGIFIKEKTRVLYKITLMGALITIITNLLLIPLLGMTGSAIATLLSYSTMAIVLGLYSRKVMDVPYRFKSGLLL